MHNCTSKNLYGFAISGLSLPFQGCAESVGRRTRTKFLGCVRKSPNSYMLDEKYLLSIL
jgi:hypothetical protein